MSKRWIAVPVLLVVLTVAVFVLYPRDEAVPGDRWSWIDAPTDGAAIPVEGTVISAGAIDPTGVALLELSADGQFVEGRLFADAPTEVSAEFFWDAVTSGEHQVTVRARGTDGTWGRATTIFVIAAPEEESDGIVAPSTVPPPPTTSTTVEPPTTTTTTPLATTTATTTTAPGCVPLAPSLVAPRDGAVVPDPNPGFSWRYVGDDPCRPRRQVIEIGPVGDGGGHAVVSLPPDALHWRPGARLRDCTNYSWSVLASFSAGELASSTWSFRTDFPKTDRDEPCP